MRSKKTNTVIKIENLTKTFGDITAVDRLNLEINRGEIFGFLGPNGAGKTTTINMICGLLVPDEGDIYIDEYNVKKSITLFRQKIGICPQEMVLWEYLTCEEQLTFIAEMYGISGKEAKKISRKLLELLGLTEKARKQARTLSGGLKRRLNIALALVNDPEIAIFDEPEAGLDPQSRVMVRDFIKSLASKKTVIFTTHNMDEAERICDRVAIIDHGKILTINTPEKLKEEIGKGDVLEISISNNVDLKELERKLKSTLGSKLKKVVLVENRLIIRMLDALHHLAKVLKIFEEIQITPEDISFRWNTLEDVFIELTGRSLRE